MTKLPSDLKSPHIQTLLKGAQKSTLEMLRLLKHLPLLVKDMMAIQAHLNLLQPLNTAFFTCLTTSHQENIIFLKNSFFALFSLETLENMFQAKSRTSSCSRVGLKDILKALDFT